MGSTAQLLWGMLFGSIGVGFFIYGKRQKNVVPLATGVALMVYPLFVSNSYLLVLIGVGLCAVPYFVRL
jgi:CHASE2 domain-containing sensor protein